LNVRENMGEGEAEMQVKVEMTPVRKTEKQKTEQP